MPRLKNHLPSRAHNHKSLCDLGQDLNAPGMRAPLNVEPWHPHGRAMGCFCKLKVVSALYISEKMYHVIMALQCTYICVCVCIFVCALVCPLEWHHNECNGLSSHRQLDCLLKQLFRCRSKKTSKLHVTGLCEANPPMTGKGPVKWKMFPVEDNSCSS